MLHSVKIKEINKVLQDSPKRRVTKRGPAKGAPQKAIDGFAGNCGVKPDELVLQKEGERTYFYYIADEQARPIQLILPTIIDESLAALPIKKSMYWGMCEFSFIRPVHWLVALLGQQVIDVEVFGTKSGRQTRGLRADKHLWDIKQAADYPQFMREQAGIEVDFVKRKALIAAQIKNLADQADAQWIPDEPLLEEVCALVEHPNAFLGHFDASFLAMPKAVLVLVMKAQQKYFPLQDQAGHLLPYFIGVANLPSKDLSAVVSGNERVIRPRLADAEFFLKEDMKATLASRVEHLQQVVFLQHLGSLHDKVERIGRLGEYIAEHIGADKQLVTQAAYLSKSDLVTHMVVEFPDLQGLMGAYYAKIEGQPQAVCDAICYQYHPRFANDILPQGNTAIALALADKLDTIVGICIIDKMPSGSKDPFALRRLALGIARMMIEGRLDLSLNALIDQALSAYPLNKNQALKHSIYEFMINRLRVYYLEKGLTNDLIDAVFSLSPDNLFDADQRIGALAEFINTSRAKTLIDSNKRIKNILKNIDLSALKVDKTQLVQTADKKLYQALTEIEQVRNHCSYAELMIHLVHLKEALDTFFAQVMVNVEDVNLRQTRLALLAQIRQLFLHVGDISYLA